MLLKSVDWSYPTSDNAKQCGKYNDGCYTISTWEPNKTFPTLYTKEGYETIEEAINAAKKINIPWHPIYSRFYLNLI